MSQYASVKSSTTSTSVTENAALNKSLDFGSNQDRQSHLDLSNYRDVVSDGLNWGSLLLSKSADLSTNSLDDMIPSTNVKGALSVASALMTGAQSFKDSPNQTFAGKGLDALLDVSGSLMLGANPVVSVIDTIMPEGMRVSELYDGTSSAISSIAEGALTDESSAMEDFVNIAKQGDYSIVMKEAVEAGEFWAKQMQ